MNSVEVASNKKQAIRLSNTLLAAGGGGVLSLILFYAHYVGDLNLELHSLAIILAGFWAVNMLFIITIYKGWNLRFKDPSLTIPQMIWASTTTLLGLLYSQHWDGVFYILVLLTMVFAVFRVSIGGFKLYCIYVVSISGLALVIRHIYLQPLSQLDKSLIYWLTFASSAIALSMLCRSIMVLRNRLREKNQELSEALQARSYFLANMSHEIRTPMNGVLGMLNVALNKKMDADLRQSLEVAEKSANGLLTIINDILDFSKIDSGRLALNNTMIDVRQFVAELKNTYHAQACDQSLEFLVEVDSSVPAQLTSDPKRLRQVLNNLLANAFKFTSSGSVQLRVYMAEQSDQSQVVWSVVDTGVGIEPQHLQKIFEAFTQVDESTTRSFGGTGLGLAICKRLVHLLGGKILVESELNGGSRFDFYLPLQLTDAKKEIGGPIEAPHKVDALAPSLKTNKVSDSEGNKLESNTHNSDQKAKAQVMLVEDNETNQAVATHMLNDLGLDVVIAENGQVALDQLESMAVNNNLPALIFMDCQMPVLDGYQATSKIRQFNNKDVVNIPIIAMTANTMEGDKEKCMNAGMTEFLAKPIDVFALEKMVNEFFPADSGSVKAPRNTSVSVANTSNEEDAELVWDKEAVLRLLRQKEERIPILLTPFLNDLDKYVQDINDHFRSEDNEGLKKSIHTLKGSSANLGARSLPKFLRAAEEQLENGERLDGQYWLEMLDKHVNDMRSEMLLYLSSTGQKTAQN